MKKYAILFKFWYPHWGVGTLPPQLAEVLHPLFGVGGMTALLKLAIASNWYPHHWYLVPHQGHLKLGISSVWCLVSRMRLEHMPQDFYSSFKSEILGDPKTCCTVWSCSFHPMFPLVLFSYCLSCIVLLCIVTLSHSALFPLSCLFLLFCSA